MLGWYLAFMPASPYFGEDMVSGGNALSVLIVDFVHFESAK
jgi:hypothetical protein